MKYVWPPLTNILRERREAIIDGLEKAAQAEKELEQANDAAGQELEQAKKQSAELISQARSRAAQLEEEAKERAKEEAQESLLAPKSDRPRDQQGQRRVESKGRSISCSGC